MVNFDALYTEKEVYVWGACERGEFVEAGLEDRGVRVLAFVDSNKSKQEKYCWKGKRCIDVSALQSEIPIVVVASEKWNLQIARTIESFCEFGRRVYYLNGLSYEEFYCDISDEAVIRTRWHQRKGIPLNLNRPQTFNEKIQWLKLHDRNPLYTRLSDKFAVKEYVISKSRQILNLKVIPTLGVWNNYREIDFSKLPEKFVLKATHDSGSIQLCTNRNTFDYELAEQVLTATLQKNYYWYDREWAYKDIPPRIIAEPYLTDESKKELKDYKIQCFNGEPKIIQVDYDRFGNHRRNIYDLEWNYLPYEIKYPSDKTIKIKKPNNLNKLLEAARVLSDGIPYVRVDLYVVENEIFFGEYTFYHGGGYEDIRPIELDYELGRFMSFVN